MSEQQNNFTGWAVVEIMGHQRLASSLDDVAPEDETDFEPEEDADA